MAALQVALLATMAAVVVGQDPNLGGFGQLQNAQAQIETRERQSILNGLPPLPMTHDEVLYLLTTTLPATTPRPTARPTTPLPPTQDAFSVNAVPEFPPIPEDRLGGKYDEDGNFVADTLTPERRKSVVRGIRNYHVNGVYNRQVRPRQVRPRQQRQNRQPAQIFRPTTFPPMIFRPKPQPVNRDPYYNNLLLEIEEYDDFLEQVQTYKQTHPGAEVANPYRALPEGKLPSITAYAPYRLK